MRAWCSLLIILLRLMLLACSDWIEHVMATDGDQYLKTPEHLLPWHVRAMLDVYLALALCFAGLVWLASLPLRSLCAGRRRRGGPAPAKGDPRFKSKGPRTFHVVAASQQGAAPDVLCFRKVRRACFAVLQPDSICSNVTGQDSPKTLHVWPPCSRARFFLCLHDVLQGHTGAALDIVDMVVAVTIHDVRLLLLRRLSPSAVLLQQMQYL